MEFRTGPTCFRYLRSGYFAQIFVVCLVCLTGCSSLSSVGLPFGGSQNRILEDAASISNAPGKSLQLPKELAEQALAAYIVEVGDTLLIEPVKFDATIRLPGDQVVQPDGYISIGEFGRYSAVNKTISHIQIEVQNLISQQLSENLHQSYALEQRERERQRASREKDDDEAEKLPLESDRNQRDLEALQNRIRESINQNIISVRLINWDSKRIYVLGEVNSPGSFTFRGNETVLDSIIEAGGVTSKANRHQIIVSRPTPCSSCRVVMQVCYDQVVQLGDASTNYQLFPGDRVFIPSLTFMDDLKLTLNPKKFDCCPRCSASQRGCELPVGCE